MAFAEDFAQCIAQYGVTVAPESIPEQSLLKEALTYVESWMSSLDPSVAAGFDEATETEPVSIALAYDEVNAAPALSNLLHAFDQAQGLKLTYLLEVAKWCVDNATPVS